MNGHFWSENDKYRVIVIKKTPGSDRIMDTGTGEEVDIPKYPGPI